MEETFNFSFNTKTFSTVINIKTILNVVITVTTHIQPENPKVIISLEIFKQQQLTKQRI